MRVLLVIFAGFVVPTLVAMAAVAASGPSAEAPAIVVLETGLGQ